MKKRLLAMLMALALLVSLMPMGVLADGPDVTADNTYNDKETAKEATGVTANKTVTDNKDGTYTVTLSVEGYTNTSSETKYLPADIVLVVDTSTSMEEAVTYKTCGSTEFDHWGLWYCSDCGEGYLRKPDSCTKTVVDKNRLDVAKDAASQFVSGLLGASDEIRIGLYDFSGSNRTDVDLTNKESTLLSAIENLYMPDRGDGTNYGLGLEGAQEILENSSNERSKFVVFLSDGEPQSGEYGIRQANELKEDGVTIFTVGIDIGNSGGAANALRNISSQDESGNDYFYRASSDGSSGNALADILAQISETIQASVQAGTDAVMTDVINTDAFELVDGSQSEGLTVDQDGKTLTWNIGDITSGEKTVSFKIKLKDGSFGKLHTNNDVNLTFDSGKVGKVVTFTKGAIGDPTVDIYKVTYTDGVADEVVFEDQVYYVSNVNDASFDSGEPSRDGYTFTGWDKETGDHEVTYTAKWEAEGVGAGYFVLVPGNIPEDFDPSDGLNADQYLPNSEGDYVPYGDNPNHKVDNTTGYIGYITEDAAATVDDMEGEGTHRLLLTPELAKQYLIPPTGAELGKVYDEYLSGANAGKYEIVWYQINNESVGYNWPNVTTNSSTKDGYHVDGYITGVPIEVRYYANDETEEYYDDETTSGTKYTVLRNTGYEEGKGPDFTRPGYSFEGWSTTANGDVEYEPEDEVTLKNSMVLYAVWEKDNSQIHSISAQVEYYFGDTLEEAKAKETADATDTVVTESSWIGKAVTVTVTPNTSNKFTGYKYDSTDGKLSYTLAANAATESETHIVKVYYVKDNDQTQPTSYTVKYTIEDAEQSEDTVTVNGTAWIGEENPQIAIAEGGIPAPANKYTGYKLDPENPTYPEAGTLVGSGTVYTVNYVKDESQTKELSYTVEYYKDGVKVEDDTQTVTKEVWINDTTTTLTVDKNQINTKDKYTGFAFDYTEPGTIPENIADKGVIKVYYAKDANKDNIPDKYQVTVKYVAGEGGSIAENAVTEEVLLIRDSDGVHLESGIVTASGSTAVANEGYEFSNWTKTVNDEAATETEYEASFGPIENMEVNGGDVITFTANFTAKDYTVTITPADIVAYVGGHEYAGVVDESGAMIDGTTQLGLPEPGYHLDLSADFAAVTGLDSDAADNLADYLTFTYSDGTNERTWKITYVGVYAYNEDGTPSRYVYSIEPATVDGKEIPVRLLYKDGNNVVDEDTVLTMSGDTVNATYSMTINPGELNQELIKVTFDNGDKTVTANVKIDPGTLTVLSVADDEDTTTAIVADGDDVTGDTVTAVGNVTYYVNESGVKIDGEERDNVKLLVDSVSNDAGFNAELEDHAADVVDRPNANTQSFYLDLVHTTNGNTQVTMGENDSLTIYWPMPDDADPTGEFHIVHYTDMDRQNTVTDIPDGEVLDTAVKGEYITFKVSSFSPFVLVYDEKPEEVPGLKVTKHDDVPHNESVERGDVVKYTITVENIGNVDLTNVVVEDTLWEEGTVIYVNGFRRVLTGDSYTIDSIGVGLEAIITYEYTVTRADEREGEIVNEVTVKAGDNVTDSDTETTPVDDGWTPKPDDDDTVYVPNWLNTTDHYAYIVGYEDGTIRPQNNITRAEVATIFFRLLTDNARERYWSTTNDFSDVAAASWYNNAISTLSNMGIINGYEDGTFKPNAPITRAEFTAIATRFFDYEAEYDGAFNDVSARAWYADYVQAAVDMGLVDGYPDGGFHPDAYITRAEACTIVNRVLHRVPHEDHLLSESVMNTWPDNPKSAWYYEDMQEATNSHDYDWIREDGETVEDWTKKLPERDWSALETEWATAYSR